MKEELNTLENKAKFFAQYWGQKVLRVLNPHLPLFYVLCGRLSVLDETEVLELKPLSSISDEDAIKSCNLSHGGQVNHNKYTMDYTYKYIDRVVQNTKVADYLRSKGYALDWNGITVEQQIEFGWVKLKD